MAEAEQNFVENNEEQSFPLQESDQHHLVGDEFDQKNIAASIHGEYDFPVNESEDAGLVAHDQSFTGDETENNFEMISEQNYADNENENENENEQISDAEQPDQGLDGIDLKQEFPENEGREMDDAPDNSNDEKKEEHKNNVGSVGSEEKKWPGWPGESVFRMLVPAQKVGNIIGRKGEYIKKIVEETRARIKILDGPPGSQERAVLLAILRQQIISNIEASKMQLQSSA